MKKTLTLLAISFIASTVLTASEAIDAYVEAPWKSEGIVMMTSENSAKFMGTLEGVLLFETNQSPELHKLPFMCPSSQRISFANMTMEAEGDCLIGTKGGDVVFANFTCKGPVGACEGKFHLKGGTGKFQGISGGSSLKAKAVAHQIADDESGLFAVKETAGVLVLPDMTFKIPTKK